MDDGEQLSLVYSSNIEPEPPFPVTPIVQPECPIPDRLPPGQKAVRPRVVKSLPTRPKQRRKANALRDLIKQVEKAKKGEK